MAAAPPQQQGDNSLTPFWIVIGIFVLGWIIWSFGHAQISVVVYKLRLWEAELVNLFVNGRADELVTSIKQSSPQEATFNDLVEISNQVGRYLSYPVVGILGLLACVIYFGHPKSRYKRTYNMDLLVNVEKEDWPQITPVVHLKLIDEDIRTGSWAVALSPIQFAKKYSLLREEQESFGEAYEANQKTVVALLREKAYQQFAQQLGPYWTSIDNLNPHTKALFAIFVAQMCRDATHARKLLLQIAVSSQSGKLNFNGTDELLSKYRHNKAVESVIGSHAYVFTVMASMLVMARRNGVLASADFLWLKPVDRSLWFMLNSVGRQTAFSEAAGPFAHWVAERTMGHKLMVPMIGEAVNALEGAIKEVVYIPDAIDEI